MKKVVMAVMLFLVCFLAAGNFAKAGLAGDYFTVTPNQKAAEINKTISLIEGIGDVDYQSRMKVYSARTVYDSLPAVEQSYVVNAVLLENAGQKLFALRDIDCNGKFDSQDAILLRKMMVGGLPESAASDVNGDGKCTSKDMIALKKLEAGL